MSAKTKNAYAKDKFMLEFVGENCPVEETIDLQQQYKDYKNSLDEINCLILHFQDIGEEQEVAYLRRLLMRTKMAMRELKQKIKSMTVANNVAKEIAYS